MVKCVISIAAWAITILMAWSGIALAWQVVDALRNGIFELTDDWRVPFRKKPLRFCVLIIVYSALSPLVLVASGAAIYCLAVR